MDVTVAVRESAGAGRARPAGERAAPPKCDLKELRSVLRAVRKATSGDGKALWLPVRPGGPTRYEHFNKVLFDAFEAQLPSSIRRLRASKPIAVRTRKVVAAMLALGKFAPAETAG